MAEPQPPTADEVIALAQEHGFALAGIAPAEPTRYAEALDAWLADGKHGEMHYLANNVEVRVDPRAILPGAQAVICVADFHLTPIMDGNLPAASVNVPTGRIARYAWGDDYHKVMKKQLHALADELRRRWPEYEYRAAVDTAPILEREHAARAGMGWIGKHTLLIHPSLGSYMLLGEIVTTMALGPACDCAPSETLDGPVIPNHCGTCTRCIDACPTDCITPYSVDASRCISYLTLEHRSAIDESLFEPMGDWLAGCDVCQDVCPYNNPATHTERWSEQLRVQENLRNEYGLRPPAPAISLLEVLNWSAEDRQKALTGSALKRIKLDMWHRNALIAAGNALAERNDAELRAAVERWADDADAPEMVRDTARTVLHRVDNT